MIGGWRLGGPCFRRPCTQRRAGGGGVGASAGTVTTPMSLKKLIGQDCLPKLKLVSRQSPALVSPQPCAFSSTRWLQEYVCVRVRTRMCWGGCVVCVASTETTHAHTHTRTQKPHTHTPPHTCARTHVQTPQHAIAHARRKSTWARRRCGISPASSGSEHTATSAD